MKTVDSMLNKMTALPVIEEVRKVLLENDPEFVMADWKYRRAVCKMSKALNEIGLEELLTAWERQIYSDLIYAGYLGFQANLQNFHNPMAGQFTRLDYETFLREHIMQALPGRMDAEETIRAFQDAFPELMELYEEDFRNYYIFLETIGPKLAHFWGYQFANHFLPWVEPGYVVDGAQTSLYAMELQRDLGFSVE